MTPRPAWHGHALSGLCAAMALLLGYRAYGYYVCDQSDFLLYARELAENGHLRQSLPDHADLPGNFHPPLMLLLLALGLKVSGLFLAPALFQLACAAGTLLVILRLWLPPAGADAGGLPRGHALPTALLFFLVPFTHQGFLFLDIDNSLLPLWGALYIAAHMREDQRPRSRARACLGLVFAFGFWCKLTTPLAVLVVWAGLRILRGPLIRAVADIAIVFLVAIVSFMSTYAAACALLDLPFAYPFALTFSKFLGGASESAGLGARLGTSLRSIFWDLHWFSAATLGLVLAKTVADLRHFSWRRKDLPRLHPMLCFWALYLGYTLVIPTLWLPRYKFGLLPFLVWWLRDDFIRLAAFRPRLLAAAATVGLLLSPLLPDLATSATRHALTFHAGSPLAPILADLPYYPAWMAGLKARLAALNAEGYLALPASGLGFLLHYLTWMGLLLPAGCAAVAAALRPCAGSWRAALLVAGLVAWSCRFAQDMRRDYALFYRAGTTGFAEMTAELKFRLAPGEVLLGRKDFGLYTGRKFYQLYRYGDHGMVADTARLAALLNDGSLRHLVYLEGEPYDDPGFQAFLDRRFEFAHRAGDYVLWKRRPEAARP